MDKEAINKDGEEIMKDASFHDLTALAFIIMSIGSVMVFMLVMWIIGTLIS